MEKNITIDGQNKEILKLKKHLEQTEKKYEHKIEKTHEDHGDQVREVE